MRIVVVGAGGQLGAAVAGELAAAHDVTRLARAALDITDDAAVGRTLEALRPDAIVNCAAYNDVDGAEDHPIDALNVNAFAVRALARAAAALGAALVHYGTDFIFDGAASSPYTEDDRPNPRSVYGASKLVGEWFAADAPRPYVLRVESLFGRAPDGPAPKGSLAKIVDALRARTEARVFEDRTITPTYIPDAARATRTLLETQAAPGTYHCVNSDECTWLELAEECARRLGVEPRLIPVRIADVKLRAQRPKYCALSNEKLKRAGVPMPTWRDAVARYLAAGSVS